MATENVFVKAKRYQKLHPRTPWQECIKKVSGKKTVSGKKRAAPVKKKATVGAKRVVKKVVVNSPNRVRISGSEGTALNELNRAAQVVDVEQRKLEQMKCVGMSGKTSAEKAQHKRLMQKQRSLIQQMIKNKNALKKYI